MVDKRKLAVTAGMLAMIGVDFASGPDSTAYWRSKPTTKPTGSTTKRAKIKAARKQRRQQ